MLVGEREQKRFSHLLKTLTNSLPDDDSEFSVFDYYVDESGEWDVWQSRCVHDKFWYRGAQIGHINFMVIILKMWLKLHHPGCRLSRLELAFLLHASCTACHACNNASLTVISHFL